LRIQNHILHKFKSKKIMKSLLFSILFCFLLVACAKNEDYRVNETETDVSEYVDFIKAINLPEFWDTYQAVIPTHLQALGMVVPTISNEKATIGRVLFYDKNLSRDRSVACASCHKQTKAFGDDSQFSVGIDGYKSTRNASSLANVASFAAYYGKWGNGNTPQLLWDNRANNVAEQSLIAFENPHEMDINVDEVVNRVKEQKFYAYMFRKAFNDDPIPTKEKIMDCLNSFVGAIGGANSKLDVGLRSSNSGLTNATIDTLTFDTIITNTNAYYSPTDTTITATGLFIPGVAGLSREEDAGRVIFITNCTKCHSPLHPLQEVFTANNGLDLDYTDQGIGAITGNPSDMGVFKSPPLRNIALTAPYMHDGRFKNLNQVVEFYSTDVKNHPNLHPLLRRPDGSTKLNLTLTQKINLLKFLETLTDATIETDKRFSNPFK
jgi:cytochrome c peroxidase